MCDDCTLRAIDDQDLTGGGHVDEDPWSGFLQAKGLWVSR